MTKLFKNSKQVFALVVVFAVLAVSLFTGSINSITADACDTSKVDYWDGTIASSFAGGNGTEANPYIIKTAEQLARCCMGQDKTASKGKFYKVDDSIKIFVMQPQSVVNLDTLLGLDSAEATKNYIEGLSGKKNWLDVMNGGYGSFNGNFDGNGATVYGLYADSVVKNDANRDCGLFPRYDGGYVDGSGNVVPNVCKNIAVKNSYYASVRRMGAISGASYGKGYGADVNGIIYYDTIAVVNCYMEGRGNINYYSEQGIVVDGGADDVSVLNNILVKGNYARNTEQNKNIGVLAAARTDGNKDVSGNLIKPKLSNSVILGADPFRKEYYNSPFLMNVKDPVTGATIRTFYENVITDQPAGKVTITNPAGWGSATTEVEYAENNVKQVTATGFGFQAAADALDWENTWFMTDDGPELRKFHGAINKVVTNTTHVWECADCGLQSPGGVAEHSFVLQGTEVKGDGTDVYACSVCGHTCSHGSQAEAAYDPGDCVTASGIYTRCNYCDWYIVADIGEVPGHELEYVPAYGGHCAENGYKEHWHCTVCDKLFATEDEFAPMEEAVTLADLSTGLGTHIKDEDEDGVIVLYDENGHWFICEIDGGRINSKNNAMADDEVEKHKFENAQCVDCGYVCEDHTFLPTGKVIHGSCYEDEKTEQKCTKCGWKTFVVSKKAGHTIVKVDEVAPDDKMEGTKAHYKCEVCKELYSDAQGNNKVTKASLIIPKQLPEGGNDVNPNSGSNNGYMVNPDTSTTSPVTGENFAPIAVAVSLIAGAALVLVRKVVKA